MVAPKAGTKISRPAAGRPALVRRLGVPDFELRELDAVSIKGVLLGGDRVALLENERGVMQ
jgi:hypothetical protein